MRIRRFVVFVCTALFLCGVMAAQQSAPNPDVNRDSIVDARDLAIVQANLGRRCGQSTLDPRADVDRNCVVNVSDVSLVSRNLGRRMNNPPVASAGSDRTARFGETITLDGSGSSDADGESLSFAWTIVERPLNSAATLADANAVRATLTIDAPGTWRFSLIVTDTYGTSSTPAVVAISTTNSAPTASAGADQTIAPNTVVSLSGQLSTDPDGDALSYLWEVIDAPAGATVTLSSPSTVDTTFLAPALGDYVIRLTVRDPAGEMSSDTVVVTTRNSAPRANAGEDRTAAVGTLVELDGSGSSDVDGDPLTYAWSFTSVPAGSAPALSDPQAPRPSFRLEIPGTYVLQLLVSDNHGGTGVDTVVVSTSNSRPIADAGPDQLIAVGAQVALDGSTSRDPDGASLSYSWAIITVPAGSTATLSDASAPLLTFVADRAGTYVLQLTVSDGTLTSEPDTVSISTSNRQPVANAGDDQERVAAGSSVTLDGRASSDPDGQTVTFNWALISRPDGSTASLSDAASPTPAAVLDVGGDYVFQLIVSDGLLWSEPDTVLIRANRPPLANAGSDRTGVIGAAIALDGRGSNDPDGDPLSYSWMLAAPAGSTAALDNPTGATPGFVADIAGSYDVRLVVHDGLNESVPDTVRIVIDPTRLITITTSDASLLTFARTTITVTTATPAPGGGLAVALQSSAPSRLAVPASLTIAEGQTSASADAAAGSEGGPATVTASAAGAAAATTTIEVLSRSMTLAFDATTVGVDRNASGTLTLLQPLTDAPVAVTIGSSDPAVVMVVPQSVIVEPGTPTALVTAGAVAPGHAVITAHAAGFTPATAALDVRYGITLSPAPFAVRRDETAELTVTLSSRARSGGATIALVSDNPKVATVPASVTIADGEYSAAVMVNGAGEGQTTIQATMAGATAASVAVNVTPPAPATIESSPANGQAEIAVTRETIIRLSRPLAADVAVTGERLFAEFGGVVLQSRVHLSPDRKTITLFYLQSLPASARIKVSFVTDGLLDAIGVPLDGDGDGQPGGVARIEFDTLTLTTLANTAVVGRVFASELGDGGVNTPLAGVIVSVDGLETTLRTTTDAMGNFRIEPAPAGAFFVHIDGRAATNEVAVGAYYPVVGKKWEGVPGRVTNVGEVYLPLVAAGTLQPVSATANTVVTFAPSVLAQHPELSGVQITVPPNALYSDGGARGGMVGIAPVAPDRLPGPPPVALTAPIVITVQTDGGTNFDQPVPTCFPNLPSNGEPALPPGAKTGLWSFNHDSGNWEPAASMTVTADGRLACTDPGEGIRAPGWHLSAILSWLFGGGARESAPAGGGTGGGSNVNIPLLTYKDEIVACITDIGLSVVPVSKLLKLDKELSRQIGCVRNATETLESCTGGAPSCRRDFAAAVLRCNVKAAARFTPIVSFGDAVLDCVDSVKARTQQILAAQPYGDDLVRYQNQVTRSEMTVRETSRLLRLMFGHERWLQLQETKAVEFFLEDIGEFSQRDSRGGYTIDAAELQDLLADLPGLEGSISEGALHELINLVNETMSQWRVGDFTHEEAGRTDFWDFGELNTAVSNTSTAAAELQQMGVQTPLTPLIDLLDGQLMHRLLETGAIPNRPAERAFPYRLTDVAGNFEQRGRTDNRGSIEGLVVSPDRFYMLEYVDPVSLNIGRTTFVAPPPGRSRPIPYIPIDSVAGSDSDGDGLSDEAERIVGTVIIDRDSDDDGMSDGAEVQQGTDPLDNAPATTGVIASVDTPGSAADVTVRHDIAVVADSHRGLSVFNVAAGATPMLIAQVPVPGVSESVAFEGAFVAVASGANGLAIVDISDPTNAAVVRQVSAATLGGTARVVAVAGTTAYVGVAGGRLVAVDMASGVVLASVAGLGQVDDVSFAGDELYVLTNTSLAIYRAGSIGALSRLGSVVVPGAAPPFEIGRKLFVGGGLAYVGHFGGYTVVDVRAAAAPFIVGQPSQTQLAMNDVAANGSNLVLGATSLNGGGFAVSAYDGADPTNVGRFLASFDTPGDSRALTIYNGQAYVADRAAGLQIVNYLAYDTAGRAPTVSLSSNFALSATTGAAEASSPMRLTAAVTDDVQVRNVDFFVDGNRVARDGSFPFEHRFVTPSSESRTSFTVRACAFDTGGNSTCTNDIVVTLIADARPPSVLGLSPAPQSTVGEVTVVDVIFSEAMAPASLAGALTLVEAGGDGQFDTPDDVAVANGVFSQPESARASLTFAAVLPPGLYRAAIAPTVADVAGNRLASGVSWTFSVLDVTRVSVVATDGEASEVGPDAATFTFTRTGSTAEELRVFFVPDGTASAGTDYTMPLQVVIPAGQASIAVTATPILDTRVEGPETIILTIITGFDYEGGANVTATATIADDPPVVTVTATDATAAETGGDTGTFTFTRTGLTTDDLQVLYTPEGSAGRNDDYAITSPFGVTIPPGQTSATVTVTPSLDGDIEGDETVVATLNASSNYVIGTPAAATITIADHVPTVTITATDANASENGPDTGELTFTRTGTTTLPLTVRYAIAGTADSTDYFGLGSVSASVTIPAGQTSVTRTVTPRADALAESAETVVVTLTAGAYAIGTPSEATVTIDDSGTRVTLTATDADASEISGDTGEVTLTRTGPTSVALTVNLSIGGTATSGDDYPAIATPVSIPSGQASRTITIQPRQDFTMEPAETVTFQLAPGEYVIGTPGSVTVTIADSPNVSVEATDSVASEIGPDSGTFTVRRTGPTTAPLDVWFSLSGTASNFDDYAALGQGVTIPAGASSATVTVAPVVDQVYEGTETVVLTLQFGTYSIAAPGSATITIADDAPVVTLVAIDADASEDGPNPAVFRVTRGGNLINQLTVLFGGGGTATEWDDYQPFTGFAVIPAGETFVDVEMRPKADSLVEDDETFILTVAPGPFYTVGEPNTATVIIRDRVIPTVTVSATDASAAEFGADPGTITFVRVGQLGEFLDVEFTVSGTAIPGTDFNYSPLANSVRFNPGVTTAVYRITPRTDVLIEGNETVTVTIDPPDFPGQYRIGAQGSATITIADEGLPTVSVTASDPQAGESLEVANFGEFTLTRTGPAQFSMEVNVTLSGTATLNVDYVPILGGQSTVFFGPGESTKTVSVFALWDELVEGTETVVLTIAPGDYVIGTPNQATVDVLDGSATAGQMLANSAAESSPSAPSPASPSEPSPARRTRPVREQAVTPAGRRR